MGNLERKQELIQEIMELIKEFRKEESIFGTDGLDSVKFDNEKQVFVIENFGYVEEFTLDKLSNIFFDEIERGMLYEQTLSTEEIENYFNELSKEEFINFIGSSFYAECRCTEIHERLKEIEKEFHELKK